MNAAGQRDGVVIDWPDLRRLDTREMPWQEFAGLEGTKIKVLARDRSGNPLVFVQWIPPGGFPSVSLPHRHYHRSVREFAYVLDGELPHWEYASADAPGEIVRFREGFFMDRRPGSIHGLEPGPASAVGCTLLMWRDGTGTMVDEPDFDEQTVDVPYPGGAALPAAAAVALADGVVLDRPDVTILDTREMPWTDFAGLDGARVKMLSRDAAGNGVTWLIWLPGELPSVGRPHRHYHRTIREFSFMVAGELPHWEYRNAAQQQGDLVVVREGYFMERLPGSVHGLEEGPSSPVGCVLLQWRDGVGNYLDEPEAAVETIDVSYER